jgi:hypothetical protein
MRFTAPLSAGLAATCLLVSAAFYLGAQDQTEPDPNAGTGPPKENQAKGIPARVAATEYQAHAQAGSVAIGAEFDAHSIPTPDHTFSSEDYIVVEAAFFGPPGAHLTLSRDDFSLRIAGRKMPLASEPFQVIMRSLKDPEWQPPETEAEKEAKKDSSGGLTTGGNGTGGGDKLPPLPPKMPFPLRRAMELQVHQAMMQEGDRALPQAGFLFFHHAGKTDNIKSLELVYSGPAGKATLELQP